MSEVRVSLVFSVAPLTLPRSLICSLHSVDGRHGSSGNDEWRWKSKQFRTGATLPRRLLVGRKETAFSFAAENEVQLIIFFSVEEGTVCLLVIYLLLLICPQSPLFSFPNTNSL